MDKVSAPIIHANESIDCKLKAVGLRPEDVDYVFIGRMDFDQASGLRLVKDAKDI